MSNDMDNMRVYHCGLSGLTEKYELAEIYEHSLEHALNIYTLAPYTRHPMEHDEPALSLRSEPVGILTVLATCCKKLKSCCVNITRPILLLLFLFVTFKTKPAGRKPFIFFFRVLLSSSRADTQIRLCVVCSKCLRFPIWVL